LKTVDVLSAFSVIADKKPANIQQFFDSRVKIHIFCASKQFNDSKRSERLFDVINDNNNTLCSKK